MTYSAISLEERFTKLVELFQPRIVAQMNNYQFKIVRVRGEFVWHKHDDTDEAFLVLDGELRIDFRDGHVMVKAGELFVVPRGKEHKTGALGECKMLLIEPAGTVNTGDVVSSLTANPGAWV